MTDSEPVDPRIVREFFHRVRTDSRQIDAGDIFWALRGEYRDGHDYVSQALGRGAVAAVVEKRWLGQPGFALLRPEQQARCLVVPDTLSALWQYANRWRCKQEALVVGVTGSIGKTTTRHLIHQVLASGVSGVESPLNFNNHVGVPLSLLEIEEAHDFAVIELAASGLGEIAQLSRVAEPEIGVITSIAPAHLESFGSLENIARAKGELLEAIPESGFALFPGDDDRLRRLRQRAVCRTISVGERAHNDIIIRSVQASNGELSFEIAGERYVLPFPGRHFLIPAALAVVLASETGLSPDQIRAGLRQFEPVRGRCCPIAIGEWTLIDDTYNSSPQAMRAACELLRDWPHVNQKILVTGDMLALGDDTEQYHTEIGQFIANCRFDRVIAIGSQAETVARMVKQHGMDAGCLGACDNMETALALLDCWLQPGDVILVKGSRAMKMERILEGMAHLAEQTPSRKTDPQYRKVA